MYSLLKDTINFKICFREKKEKNERLLDILDFDERVKAKEQKNLGPVSNVPGE